MELNIFVPVIFLFFFRKQMWNLLYASDECSCYVADKLWLFI